MRRITVSVLSMLIISPALSNARLPVVNVAAGSVSARSAFGESSPMARANTKAVPEKTVSDAQKPSKKLVARPAVKSVKNIVPDNGGDILANADVLMPRRPSADLWAHTVDAPLRMPDASEFAVVRSDRALPEENLDSRAPRAAAPVARAASTGNASELDAQIAHLVQLQRRADDSVRTAAEPAAVAQVSKNVVARPRAPRQNTIAEKDNIVAAAPAVDSTPVSVRRMVVPMESDVVVRSVEKSSSPQIAAVRDDMTRMTPTELRKAFRKTFLSENKHLSTFQIDDRFDVASDMNTSIEGFTAKRDLSEDAGVRTLEIKISFRDDDSALSRDNYNLLTEYASIVVSNPKRAIQVAIPQRATRNMDDRKLAARRLAIVEQVLRDTGVAEQRIVPVLSQRDEDGFVLRIISNDQYETLTRQTRDMFGDTVSKKTYKSMSW